MSKTIESIAWDIECEAAGIDDPDLCLEESDEVYARWTSMILDAIRELIPGVEISSEREGCGSSYHDLSLPGRWSEKIRISNHKQRYGGTIWSFEVDDKAKTHANGLRAVIEAVNAAEMAD